MTTNNAGSPERPKSAVVTTGGPAVTKGGIPAPAVGPVPNATATTAKMDASSFMPGAGGNQGAGNTDGSIAVPASASNGDAGVDSSTMMPPT
jgi:hypothetical protein